MEQQHIDTIEDTLLTERARLEDMIKGWKEDSAPYKRHMREIADIDAALLALRAHTPQPLVPSEVIALVNLALAHAEYELSEYVTDAQRDVVRAWLAQQPDA